MTYLIIYILLLIILIFVTGMFVLLYNSPPKPSRLSKREQEFFNHETGKKDKFPYLKKKGDLDFSLVVPCFNEELRLKIMLDEALAFLQKKMSSFEIIIVDDGSTDTTTPLALEIAQENNSIRVLTLEKNRGKGGAVMQGIMATRGELILFADADGATRFSDLDLLIKKLDEVKTDGFGMAIGSRAHMVSSDAVVKRSFIRNILMKGFHFIVYVLGIQTIKDTQCGFKLLTRKTALQIAPSMHVQGWIFDIEMLILAFRNSCPVAEVPVHWHEVDGSKMSLITASIEMLLQLMMIRLNYTIGRWK